ncbi:MAG: hypothetical protein JO093_13645 [Acidobacteria bacterium]|nr:hypothetical protein [Acidobacteriota bacterium]MBV9186657.1 hypothetical protein [Acidobacteriota bacterium]
MDKEELRLALTKFAGTVNYYRHWTRAFHYTDGVAFLADNAGAYWLLDHIAAMQKRARRDSQLREFQAWKLTVNGTRGVIACLRDKDDEAFRDELPFTDFPLAEITLYLQDGVLYLPSEG